MNAISTNVHSTTRSAKPPLPCRTRGRAGLRLGRGRSTAYNPFGLATPGLPLRCSCCGTRPALIMDHMRGNQHQQLAAGSRVALGRNQRAEDRDVLEEGYAGVIIPGIVADQTGHPDRLAVLDSHSRAE